MSLFRSKDKTEFPPEKWKEKFAKFNEWKAWYSGDKMKLLETYDVPNTEYSQPFWSDIPENEWMTKLHIPLANDIASTSADLLFNDMPKVKVTEAHQNDASTEAKNTQDRLDELLRKNRFHSVLVESAESNSALGGSYLKINWSPDFKSFPILSVAHSDTAIPSFRQGFLEQVTFFKVVKRDGSDVWRKLEIHTSGTIKNRLYKGTKQYLGNRKPLDELDQTKNLDNEVSTGIDDLLVRYIPNKKPNALWLDSSLGNSDFQGLEGLLDQLDDTYTDWMDEMDLAKADKLVPADWLDYDDSSGELKYNKDKSTFTALDVPPSKMDKPIMIQPNMRTEKYEQTCLNLIERIVSSAGYSPQTFGLKIEGRAESGTALKVREDKSYNTKARKEKHFKEPLQDILDLLLKVDKQVFNSSIDTDTNIAVNFTEANRESPNDMAESIEKLKRARAMSIVTRVRELHPDWSEQEVKDEVERIKQEMEKGQT